MTDAGRTDAQKRLHPYLQNIFFMNKLDLKLDASAVIGKAQPLLYGGLLEHLGRAIYGGAYAPDDPTADADGFRQDVLEAVKGLRIAIARYPGGCYTDLWCWEDCVGPHRAVRLDPAWKQLEPNIFGLHEFIRWCRKGGIEPMLTLNVGLRNALDAARLVEYCNFPGGTELSDLRRAHGAAEPFGIKYFCLGNELYAPWEFGRTDAPLYALRARECAKVIHALCPDAKLILCGCGYDNDWNRQVLEVCYNDVDCISLHFGFGTNDPDDIYYHTLSVHEKTLEGCAAIIADLRAKNRRDHRVSIAIDEWIVWDGSESGDDPPYTVGRHLLEQNFPLRESLMCGAFLSRLLHNHCDCVDIACVAQIVNVIAPIRTAPNGVLWRQGNYGPMAYAARYGVGDVLRLGALPDGLHASAVRAADNSLALFVTNLNFTPCALHAELADMAAKTLLEAVVLHSDDETAFNTPESTPLQTQPLEGVALSDNGAALSATLPPRSWACLRMSL